MSDQVTVTVSPRALRRAGLILLTGLIGVAVVFAAWQQRDRLDLGGVFARGAGDQIDRSTYQAVFLTGGQVYFGQLQTHGEAYFTLRDVYYLSPQGNENPTSQNPGQLIKRGRELHGPQDEMIIPVQNVLFIENLRPDGDVMIAIRQFKQGGLPPSTPAPSTPAPTTPRPSPSPSPTR